MSMLLRRILMVWLGVLLACSAEATTTKARLLLPVGTVKPGATITVGVQLDMAPGWHIYWRNPGESGIATKIAWSLPEGITAGEIQWPAPEKYEAEGLITYILHDQAMLLVPLTVGANVPPGDLALKAKVSWLECEKSCVPGRTDVSGALKVTAETKPGSEQALIQKWQAKLPKPNPTLKATARWDGPVKKDTRDVIIEFNSETSATDWDFYPYQSDDFSVGPKTEKLGLKDGRFALRKNVSVDEGKWPTEIKGLLVSGSNGKDVLAYETSIPFAKLAAASPNNESASAASPKTPPINPAEFAIKLAAAFLAGIILNFMPCVLPVISLKILSFVKQSQEDPARVRFLGLVYGIGVLVSFLILAGIVIAVKKAGYLASWGFQFQNPLFLVCMIILVTLVALNLFGVFEVSAGGNVLNSASGLASKKGAIGAFFNGLLTTVLATSCTAPVLSGALGYALFLSPAAIALFFLTIGAGLAFPYVILCWFPSRLNFLPKPGPWMEKFKMALGFPVLAVTIWLLDIAIVHYGRLTLWLGFFLVILSLSAWIWGEFVQKGTKRRGLAMAFAFAFLLSGYFYGMEFKLNWRNPPVEVANTAGNSEKKTSPDEIAWSPWSAEAVTEARNSGHPVFVEFTADWCTNCQLNRASSIEIESTREKLKAVDAVALLGDFTKQDPKIAAELLKFKRPGVPLVLVYPADPNSEPIVLPELLTPGIVLDALEKAAPKKLSSAK